jgi:hypothetical protein
MSKMLHKIRKIRHIIAAIVLIAFSVIYFSFDRDPYALAFTILAVGVYFQLNFFRVISIGIFGFYFCLPFILNFMGSSYGLGDSVEQPIKIMYLLICVILSPFIVALLWKKFDRKLVD